MQGGQGASAISAVLTRKNRIIGLLAGMSRQIVNQGPTKLTELGQLDIGHGSVTILPLELLARYEG